MEAGMHLHIWPHYKRRVLADFLTQADLARLHRIAFIWSWGKEQQR